MKKRYFLLFLLFSVVAFSQPITVNSNTYTVPQLVQDVLINSQCAQISNISWRTGNTNGQGSENGIGYFQNTNPNFPIQSGVILSTGRATSAPGPNTSILSQGSSSWTGDADLKTQMIQAGVITNSFNYTNASYIQFNFTPLTDSFSFNFLFASEEYGMYQCSTEYSDAFAFILTNLVTGQSTNLAVVPGTTQPISVFTVKDAVNNTDCPSANSNYFGMYYPENGFPPAPIQFNGRTKVMSASGTVIPNTPYRIKMVIADGGGLSGTDTLYDSAVFLQAGSFNVGQASLGSDLTVDNLGALCPGEIRTLSTGLDPAFYTFQWTLDGDNIPGANGPSYGVSAPGLYGVIITNNGGACVQQPDPIRVEVFPQIQAGTPVDLFKCGDGTTPVSFDLNENHAAILAGLDPGTIITYHLDANDLPGGGGYIQDPSNYMTAITRTIFVRVSTGENDCYVTRQFDVNVMSCTADPVRPDDVTVCDTNNDGVETFDLTQFYTTILGGQAAADYNITFHLTQTAADNNTSPITPANAFTTGTQTVYIRMERADDPTVFGTTSFQLIIKALPIGFMTGPEGICSGSSAVISFEGTPGATINYKVDGQDASITLSATGGGSVLTPPLTANTVYSLVSVVSNDSPQCTQNLTGNVSITVFQPPTVTLTGDATICSGGTAVLTFNGTPDAVVTYNNGTTDLSVTLDASGEANVTVGPLTANTTYSLVRIISSGTPACMTSYTSGGATITVNPLPTATISAPALICSGDTAVVSFTGPANGVVTYSDGTTTMTINLDATGNASITTPALTAAATYSLMSVSTDPAVTPVCTQNQNASVTIGVKALPEATITGPASVCSGSSATIVINGTPNATVTYTFDGNTTPLTVTLNSAGTASVTTAPLTGPITYQLISVTSSGTPACSQAQTGSHTVTTVVAPTIFNPTPLEMCNDNYDDGVVTFDLSVKLAEITGGDPNLTVTFHETPEDAQLGNYPIQMPLYTNINPVSQILYIRVVNTGVNACASFSTLTLIVHERPTIVQNVSNYELCETSTPGDGVEIFNLTTKDAEVSGTQTGITVTYYLSEANALAGTSPITVPTAYQNGSNPETIWYQLQNAHGCIAVGSFQLIVNPLPSVPMPVPAYTLCDYTGQPLYEQFDLSTKIPEIIGTATGLEVKFYKTEAQAHANVAGTELPTLYTNEVATVQTIFVNVTNSTTGCYSVTAMDLRVEPLPVLIMPTTPVTVCDGTNNDGIGSFDLNDLVTDMLSGETNVTVSFHETQQNAQNGLFPITIMPYENINPWNQTLWVLATNNVTGCKSVYSFQLRVEPAPIMPTLLDLDECDTDSNPHDNQTTFDLTVHTATILAAQTGAATDYEVNYYISQTNAENGTPFIVSNGNFIGTNGQTIWVRVTHIATGCYTIGSFKLIVNSPLQLTQPDEITLCDDALPNDQRQIFDLTIREAQITGGATGYTFKYYSSTALPPNPGTLITNPTAFPNTATVQTLLVEVISGAGCSSYVTLTIRVTPLPEPKFDPAPLVLCDDDYPGDGITFFDVTVNANYIRNNANYVLTYHASQTDALAGINAIATPTNWQNVDGNGNALTSVWIRVTTAPANNRDRCSLVVEQPLIVNPRPAAGPVTDYHMCQIPFTGSGVFDLSTKTPEALAGQGPAGYTVTYHATQADADSGAAPLATNHPSTVNGETIYVRVVNTATGCYNTTSFQLFVERGSEATDIPDITRCDDLNDGTETFDLSSLDATILGPVQAADPNFSVSYYASDADLANGTPIGTPGAYTITDYLTHEIIAVVKNTYSAYGCLAEIRFNITVFRLPEPTPNAGFVCVDQETGNVLNTHIIDSGLDAATHTFQWYEDDASGAPQPIAGATGSTYEVNHAGTYSVIATSTVTGCVSLPAEVVITQSEPAEVTYTVSNAFTDNQVITVQAIGIGEYMYQLDEGDIQSSPVFTNVNSGTHTITVYDMKGCAATIVRNVTVINYPHYFTPNGDNYHDFWNIGDLENDVNAKIYIFDRYGKLLKQIKPSRVSGWDGTLNGQPLPSTDYWFTVNYTENGELKEFKAHFSLKR
ncbi:T9SS type B sorting domain-containing protein [Flavobacterium cerinum]|uniref:T9SS type B sorting domain-containing protein n=1 Tax=Flavobacterium cerinum TaxID=2502784 RepID=A0ABY5IWS1_9FLAO|nr:choice-of-anchor L domain-containing protein [Flavobacterium cerinum]UUC46730.1 T9SS type B sorting domain-containing protein [Flavobacterium cerinum]